MRLEAARSVLCRRLFHNHIGTLREIPSAANAVPTQNTVMKQALALFQALFDSGQVRRLFPSLLKNVAVPPIRPQQ